MFDRRVKEASSLRALFQEQWRYLKKLSLLWHHRRQNKQNKKQVKQTIETIVDGTSGKIRIVDGYHRQLKNSAQLQLEYVAKIATKLHVIVGISDSQLVKNQLLSAIFYDKNQLHNFFNDNHCFQEFIKTYPVLPGQKIYGLLTIRCSRKTVFRSALRNDQVINDVKQELIEFSHKNFIKPTPCKKELLSFLTQTLHERLTEQIKIQLDPVMNGGYQPNNSAQPQSLVTKNPIEYLNELKQLLSHPEKNISLQAQTIATDRFGIVFDDASERQLSFTEITIGDEAPFVLMPISYVIPA